MERTELARLLVASLGQIGDPTHCGGAVAEARDVVVVEERAPARFRAAFADAVAAGGTVFLANPDWGAAERAQFNALVATSAQPPTANLELPTPKDRSLGQSQIPNPKSQIGCGWLCIPTGGSAGKLKLARHDQDTLHAAVHGFAQHFGVVRVNAVGVLPLHHVGGLLGWLRCALTGGEFLAGDWPELAAGKFPVLPRTDDGWFLSLVPTQLSRLLARPGAGEWLRGFRAVLVGGGPAWPELAAAGVRAGLPLAFTYGATETAAAVAALRPEEFLAGGRGCGAALPHANLTLAHDGEICVRGASVFRGYWPEPSAAGAWVSADRGFFDARGSLHVLGRRDAVIITGGEKVEPAEVEAVLRATGEFADVAVVGVPDAAWGSVVVACYPGGPPESGVGAPRPPRTEPDWARVAAGLEKLAVWKRPKKFAALAAWPRDVAGKIDRVALARLAV